MLFLKLRYLGVRGTLHYWWLLAQCRYHHWRVERAFKRLARMTKDL